MNIAPVATGLLAAVAAVAGGLLAYAQRCGARSAACQDVVHPAGAACLAPAAAPWAVALTAVAAAVLAVAAVQIASQVRRQRR